MFVRADGAASGGNMSFFAFAGYTGADGNANHCNLAGMELDVGRTGASAFSGTRNGIGLVSIGNTLGNYATDVFDSAIMIATGPQYNGAGQTTAGWGVGIGFRDLGSSAGLNHPIAPDGYLMKAMGAFGVKTIFDFANVTPSDSILRTPTVIWTPASLGLFAANASIEIGSIATAGAAYIDFHTDGTSHDYSARIIAGGGTGADGTADMVINAGSFQAPSKVGFGIAPTVRATLPAAATDPATTMALANAIRTALINKGLTA
jgi:hypothetical protein